MAIFIKKQIFISFLSFILLIFISNTLEANQKKIKFSKSSLQNQVKMVKIYFRYYMNPNETPPDISTFNGAINILNNHYRLDGIQQFIFFYKRCETEIITNRPDLVASSNGNSFFNQPGKKTDGITIHINNAVLNPRWGQAINEPGDEVYQVLIGLQTSNLSHEVGHCLGVLHTFQGICIPSEDPSSDECEDTAPTPPNLDSYIDSNTCGWLEGVTPECNDILFSTASLNDVRHNIMSYNHANCRYKFTPCQFQKMHDNVLQNVIHESIPPDGFDAISCSTNDFKEYIINCNEIYDFNFDVRMHGKIVIKNGASLTIKRKTFFTESSEIIVEQGGKLIVDGATLTKCPDAASWKGIKAKADLGYIWGWTNQPTTELILRNGAIVEHAETAINAIDQITIFNTSNVGGAKITMTGNSTIRYCTNGINLGPIYGKPELSSFTSCNFIDNDFAIFLDNNNGLTLIDNTFDLNYLDVEAMTSSLYADNNTFNSGVVFHNNFPVFQGSTFIGNRFYAFQTEHGITIDAQSNANDFFIQNNQFFGTGIITLGELDFDIAKNDFHDAEEGTWINDSGDNIDNFVRENSFYDNTYGNSASGMNDTEYLKNCFENIETLSIEVNELASIHEKQGINEDAAGNCFSFSGRVGTGPTSEFFEYYVLQNTTPQSCKKPGNGGNFSEEISSFDEQQDCGTGINIYGALPPFFRNCMYGNGMTLEQLIAAIRAEILAVEANTNLDPWTKKWLLAKYRRCLDRHIKQKAREDKDQGGRQAAITFLSAQPEFRYQSMAYGLVTETGDLSGARNILNTLDPGDAGETEYISAQYILLDYLEDRVGYLPSSVTLSALYNAGLRKHPLAGYSRSVYYTLTGQKVPITLTHLNGGTQIRSSKEVLEEHIIYPNPSNGELTIKIQEFNNKHQYSCKIHNVNGSEVYQSSLNGNLNSLQVNIENGVYFISLFKNNSSIQTQKWVVIK